ncbi:MAG: dihydroorotate dehydrogenase electron transfer subunit [Candidatus Dormibacteraeota bacterium]|nr:dihydroorotate dehydrogenase electron transfer subunit [Candidatus Dormibacteraeota bacterium]
MRLPHLAQTARAGEFAQLRCTRSSVPLLRRPFSVAWADGDACSFVFDVVGAGTAALAALRPGDTIDVLGPLGTGFSPSPAQSAVCVAGGVGCAPFPLLVRDLAAAGVQDIVVLNGAATSSRLYPAERFDRVATGVRVIEATDDGSRGHRGWVTDLLTAALSEANTAVYACGPNAMLGAVARLLREACYVGLVEASLEAPMGCGFGTCLGCAVPVRSTADDAWALCCSDGPVFRSDEVDWDTLHRLPEAHVA